jgi:hypothetical protein
MRQGKVEEKIILGDLSQEISGNEMLSMLKNEEFSLFASSKRPTHHSQSPHIANPTVDFILQIADFLFTNR